MKKIFSHSLMSVLCISLLLGGRPLRAQAGVEKDEETTFAEFQETVLKDTEALYGPNGPAEIVEVNGEEVRRPKFNLLDKSGISAEEKEKVAANTVAWMERNQKDWEELVKKQNEVQKASGENIKNESCPTCGDKNLAASVDDDSKIPKDGLCSKKEKNEIEKLRETKPQCSLTCELRSAGAGLGLTVPILLPVTLLLRDTKDCKIDYLHHNIASCAIDFFKALFSSLNSMFQTAWDGVTGFLGGLFSSNNEGENSASDKATTDSNMSDEDIKKGQEDPKGAAQSFMDKAVGVVSWIGENLMMMDVPMYKELNQCAKCGERFSALCKTLGIVGKDVIKNLIVYYLGGKLVQGAGFLLQKTGAVKGMSALLKKTGDGAKFLGEKLVEKSSVAAKIVNMGARGYTRTTEATIKAFNAFAAKPLGKKLITKTVSAGKAVGTFAINFIKIGDAVISSPVTLGKAIGNSVGRTLVEELSTQRLLVQGGDLVKNQLAGVRSRVGILNKTPKGAISSAAKESELVTVEKIGEQKVPLKIGTERPLIPEIDRSKKFFNDKRSIAGKKLRTDGMENAAIVPSHDIVNEGSIKVLVGEKEVYIAVQDSKNVKQVFTYEGEQGAGAFIRDNSGNVHLVEIEGAQGKIVSTVTANKVSKIEALLGKEDFNANVAAVKEVKGNLEANGTTVLEVNSTNLSRQALKNEESLFIKEADGAVCNPPIQIGPAGSAL